MDEYENEEELRRRATILFTRPLNEEGIRNLFFVLSGDLDSGIKYCIERWEEVGGNLGTSKRLPRRVMNLRVSGAIHPNFSLVKDGVFLAPFEGLREKIQSDPTKIEGIRFFIVPGYGMSDVSPGEISLYDDVRGYVDSFFGAGCAGS